MVIHMAATLRLEAALKDAIIQNTLGTKRVLELCKKMKKIEASFVLIKLNYLTVQCQFILFLFDETFVYYLFFYKVFTVKAP